MCFFLAARAKQAEKLFSLFLVCGKDAVLARPRRRACKDGSHTAVRLRILCMALALAFLSSAGSCAGRNTPRNSAFRRFLSGPASATRTCLALVPSRLWWYNTPDSRVSNMEHSFVVAAATSRGGALRRDASLVSSIRGGIQILFQRGSLISLFAAPRFNRPEPVRARLDGGGCDKVK